VGGKPPAIFLGNRMTELRLKKDDIFEQAQKEFGVKLDRRLKLSDLEDRYELLAREKKNPTPKVKLKYPKVVKNIFTGHEFEYIPQFKGNSSLEVIEWTEVLEDGDN
jgi:hypothetical protein